MTKQTRERNTRERIKTHRQAWCERPASLHLKTRKRLLRFSTRGVVNPGFRKKNFPRFIGRPGRMPPVADHMKISLA